MRRAQTITGRSPPPTCVAAVRLGRAAENGAQQGAPVRRRQPSGGNTCCCNACNSAPRCSLSRSLSAPVRTAIAAGSRRSGPRSAAAADVQPSAASNGMDHDDQVQVGTGAADLSAGRAVRRRSGRSERCGPDLHRSSSLSQRLHPAAAHSSDRRARHGPPRDVSLGVGEDFSRSDLAPYPVDGFVTAQANMAHFASARGITEVQVHAIGPFQLTYVHPEDDPTTKK